MNLSPRHAVVVGLVLLSLGIGLSVGAFVKKAETGRLYDHIVILDTDKIYSAVFRYMSTKQASDQKSREAAVEAVRYVEQYAKSLVDQGYVVLNGKALVSAPKGVDKTGEVLTEVLERLDDGQGGNKVR